MAERSGNQARQKLADFGARAKANWRRLTAYWPRLIFLLTFLFAGAVLTFSLVGWIQCLPCKSGRQSAPPFVAQSVPAATSGQAAAVSQTPADNQTRPPQDEPNQAGNVAASTGPKLLIPVAGIKEDQLRDTFSEARSEGRTHNAIDIIAPRGTPVLAAVAGKIARLFTSDRGGLTIYQLSPDEKLVFYYAHLERYADGMADGRIVKQGEVIGYVGDTGNAGAGNYHLHFAVWQVTDPKRYWDGMNLNPYPLLREKH